eukprot:m.16307 g.16307  ORF g.16307 m.16307 type:complete len:588 (-) comp10981_c0_seq1:679-2442(-)
MLTSRLMLTARIAASRNAPRPATVIAAIQGRRQSAGVFTSKLWRRKASSAIAVEQLGVAAAQANRQSADWQHKISPLSMIAAVTLAGIAALDKAECKSAPDCSDSGMTVGQQASNAIQFSATAQRNSFASTIQSLQNQLAGSVGVTLNKIRGSPEFISSLETDLVAMERQTNWMNSLSVFAMAASTAEKTTWIRDIDPSIIKTRDERVEDFTNESVTVYTRKEYIKPSVLQQKLCEKFNADWKAQTGELPSFKFSETSFSKSDDTMQSDFLSIENTKLDPPQGKATLSPHQLKLWRQYKSGLKAVALLKAKAGGDFHGDVVLQEKTVVVKHGGVTRSKTQKGLGDDMEIVFGESSTEELASLKELFPPSSLGWDKLIAMTAKHVAASVVITEAWEMIMDHGDIKRALRQGAVAGVQGMVFNLAPVAVNKLVDHFSLVPQEYWERLPGLSNGVLALGFIYDFWSASTMKEKLRNAGSRGGNVVVSVGAGYLATTIVGLSGGWAVALGAIVGCAASRTLSVGYNKLRYGQCFPYQAPIPELYYDPITKKKLKWQRLNTAEYKQVVNFFAEYTKLASSMTTAVKNNTGEA